MLDQPMRSRADIFPIFLDVKRMLEPFQKAVLHTWMSLSVWIDTISRMSFQTSTVVTPIYEQCAKDDNSAVDAV